MKLLFTIFLLYYCFNVSGQCNESYKELTSHELDKVDVFHRSDHSLFSNNEKEGMVLKREDKSISVVYSGGLWMGGTLEGGELRVSTKKYSSDIGYVPGVLDDDTGSISNETCDDWNIFFTVTSEEVYDHVKDFDDDGIINNVVADNVLYYPGIGNVNFVDKYGWELPSPNMGGFAEFFDRSGNGIYEPLQGDYPLITGTSSTYFLGNDQHANNYKSVGMEMHVVSSVNDVQPILAKSANMKIRAVYHGTEPIYDFYFGIWLDVDLGCFEDDLVGCLPDSNLVFFYGENKVDCNNDNFDDEDTPLLLVKYKVKEDKMSSFISTSSSSNEVPPGRWGPETIEEAYRNLQGIWRDGTSITFGGDGYNIGNTDTVKYLFDHSENNPYGPYLECEQDVPNRDVRSLVNFGPYTILPGQTTEIEFSVHLIEESGTHCPTEADVIAICNEINNPTVGTAELDNSSRSDMEVYPNPTSRGFSITSERVFDRIVVSSITGQQILEKNTTLGKEFGIMDFEFNQGVYFVQIFIGDLEVGVRKLVKY